MSRNPRRIAVLLTLLTTAGLAGCGKMGALERPGPLFGKGGAPAAQPASTAQDPSRPISTVDPRDRSAEIIPEGAVPAPAATPDR